MESMFPCTLALVLAAGLALVPLPSAHAEDGRADGVTVMPKMTVDTSKIVYDEPWRYIAVRDYEVLSQCDSEQTDSVARHIANSLLFNRRFVPERYLAPLPVPMTFIIFNRKPAPTPDPLMPAPMEWDWSNIPDFGRFWEPHHGLAGGVLARDSDTQCVAQNRRGKQWNWAGGQMTTGPIPTGFLFELGRCAPAVPQWYQYGLTGPSGLIRGGLETDVGLVMPKAVWVTASRTQELLDAAQKAGGPPVLPPIQGLFRKPALEEGAFPSAMPSPEWMAEAGLFVHWGFDPDEEKARGGPLAFATFLERSRSEPVTEAVFRDCFGFGYAEMQRKMSAYLPVAARYPLVLDALAHDDDGPRFPDYSGPRGPAPQLNRPATDAEVARILGDWERMQGDSAKATDPALSRAFLDQAGKTLRRCYAKGERDPRLLAVLGLYHFDVGDLAEARSMLTAATSASVVRPAAYVELARLALDEAKAHPEAQAGRFSARQVAGILGPLFAIRKSQGFGPDGYRLIAEAWAMSAAKPQSANLAVLNAGLALYPFDADLCYAAAVVYGQWGYASECSRLIEHGIQFGQGDEVQRFLRFRASLSVPK
jgi:hypothetical protein